jgi:hypothetical protein
VTRATVVAILGHLQGAGFFVVMGLLLAEHDGFIRAEKREDRIRAAQRRMGTSVPEEYLAVPRNLIPAVWRGRLNLVTKVAFAVFLVALVAGYIVK